MPAAEPCLAVIQKARLPGVLFCYAQLRVPGGDKSPLPCPYSLKAANPRLLRRAMPMLMAAARAMIAAGAVMTVLLMLLMMLADDIGIIAQFFGQQIRDRLIRAAGNPAVKRNPRFRQRGFGPRANTAADQRVHAAFF